MTIFLVKIFLHRSKRVERLIHIRAYSLERHEMSLNIDMKIVRPVKSSGCMLMFDMNSWTLKQSCNVVNPGKIFHSNSIGSPSIVSKVLYLWWTFEPRQLVLPNQYLVVGSRSSFQSITQNLKIRKPSRARDWWFLHHRLKIIVSMQNPPWLIVFTPIHLIWLFGYQLFRYVEHLFHCEILFLFFLMECKISR